jgi:Cyclic phosphodiesterase-like protein
MTGKVHSLWLMPDATAMQDFVAAHRDLARRFNAPRFDPHLTLIGGSAMNLAGMKAWLSEIARGIAPFSAPVADVVTGPEYFRSFYALFTAEGAILELKRRSMAMLDEGVGDFMPHVSLLYGQVEPKAKETARVALASQFNGRAIGFDSLAISLSGPGVEVEDWVIEHQIVLG